MPLGGDDAQAAQRLDVLVVLHPSCANVFNLLLPDHRIERLVRLDAADRFFHIATQHNVCATACHVGGNRDHFGAACLRHDVGLARMLFGVEHLVRQLFFIQQLGNDFRVLNRGGAYQHRLASVVTLADILD